MDAVLTRLNSSLLFSRHLLDHHPFPSLPSPPLPSAPLPNRQVRRSPTTGHGRLGGDTAFMAVFNIPSASAHVIIVTVVACVWTFFTCLCRIFLRTKVNGPIGPDDVACLVATVSALALRHALHSAQSVGRSLSTSADCQYLKVPGHLSVHSDACRCPFWPGIPPESPFTLVPGEEHYRALGGRAILHTHDSGDDDLHLLLDLQNHTGEKASYHRVDHRHHDYHLGHSLLVSSNLHMFV